MERHGHRSRLMAILHFWNPAEDAAAGSMALYRSRIAATGVAMSALLALTACSASSDDDKATKSPNHSPKVSSSSKKSAPATDPDESDKKAALEVYDAYSAEEAKAYRKASAKETDLEKYAGLDALSKVELDLAKMKEAGNVVRGKLGHDPKIAKLAMKGETPTATIEDCVDLSNYQTYDTKAKKAKPLPSEQPLQYIVTVTMERWDGGRWMVTDTTPQGERTC